MPNYYSVSGVSNRVTVSLADVISPEGEAKMAV